MFSNGVLNEVTRLSLCERKKGGRAGGEQGGPADPSA